jgi:hypothetical protein
MGNVWLHGPAFVEWTQRMIDEVVDAWPDLPRRDGARCWVTPDVPMVATWPDGTVHDLQPQVPVAIPSGTRLEVTDTDGHVRLHSVIEFPK